MYARGNIISWQRAALSRRPIYIVGANIFPRRAPYFDTMNTSGKIPPRVILLPETLVTFPPQKPIEISYQLFLRPRRHRL